MKQLLFLFTLILISCSGEKSETPPNIVFILADDLGYADLSSYGSSFINTPHLDQMAQEGVKLTSYYAAQPVLSLIHI